MAVRVVGEQVRFGTYEYRVAVSDSRSVVVRSKTALANGRVVAKAEAILRAEEDSAARGLTAPEVVEQLRGLQARVTDASLRTRLSTLIDSLEGN